MSTSTVSGTIQDPSGQVFANGTWQLVFKPTPNTPGLFTDGGAAFTKLFGGTLDNAGSFSQAGVARNDTIAPAGSKWTLIVVPNANGQAYSVDLNINNAVFSASATINAVITNITVPATSLAHAYKDSEIIVPPSSGALYYNEVSKSVKAWDIATSGWITLANSSAPSVPLFSRDCRVDGILDVTGAVDSSSVINTCITNAITNQQSIVIMPCGNFKINTTLNLTNRPGIRFTGCGWQANVANGPIAGVGITNLWCNTGNQCIETLGSKSLEIDHMNIVMCCAASMGGSQTNPSTIGIVQGRDNTGGGGVNNPFCFAESQNFHDIYIQDNGAGTTLQNGGRGQIGIYNVGAENGIYSNINITISTPMVFTTTEFIGAVGAYATITTGCPLSMVGEVFENLVIVGTVNTFPLIEANNTSNFSGSIQGLNGSSIIKFENTFGGAVVSDWFITGVSEQSTVSIISTSVGMDNMRIHWGIGAPVPGLDLKILANNLTLSNCEFNFGHANQPANSQPFIDNVATGTLIKNCELYIGAATSSANTIVSNSIIFANQLTDAQIVFNAASNYDQYTSSGISTVGTRRATQNLVSNGSLAAPGYAFTSFPTSGWFFNAATQVQLAYGGNGNIAFNGNGAQLGSGMLWLWANAVDPVNGVSDLGLSRDAAGILDIGTGVQGNKAGSANLKRIRYIGGTAYSGADAAIVLSSGWGTTRTVSAANGFDQAFSFTVNATGTGQAASPTITITFKDGTWTNPPVVDVSRNDNTLPTTSTFFPVWTVTATVLTITMNGTPTAGNSYNFVVSVSGV